MGRRCDKALFSEKKGFSVKRGEAIQWMGGLVRISTGKAIQWRGPGDSVNRRTLKSEKLLSSSPSRKSALRMVAKMLVVFSHAPTSVASLLQASSFGGLRRVVAVCGPNPLHPCARCTIGTSRITFNFFGSAKTDPVRFKWGFGEVLLKDKFAFKSLFKVLCPRRENCLQNAHFYKQKGPCLKNL